VQASADTRVEAGALLEVLLAIVNIATGPRLRLGQGDAGEVDTGAVEPQLGEVHRVRAGAAPEVDSAWMGLGRNPTRLH
jgi:hypothetical protein